MQGCSLLDEHPLCWRERKDRARHPGKKLDENMGEMLLRDPVRVDIQLIVRLCVFICGCCPGDSGLATPKEAALLVRLFRGGSTIPFYRQKEALTYLWTREILNFKARSYFHYKIQVDRDCC